MSSPRYLTRQQYLPSASVSVVLADDVDASRGDVIVPARDAASVSVATRVDANVVWMSDRPLTPARTYLVKHTTRILKARVAAPSARLNFAAPSDTGANVPGSVAPFSLNEIGRTTLQLSGPIVCDAYRACRTTGAFIMIDEASNETVGAGMIV